MAVILSNMIFFVPKKAGAHLQYACNIYAMIQTDSSKTVGGFEYTNFFRRDGQTDRQTDRGKT